MISKVYFILYKRMPGDVGSRPSTKKRSFWECGRRALRADRTLVRRFTAAIAALVLMPAYTRESAQSSLGGYPMKKSVVIATLLMFGIAGSVFALKFGNGKTVSTDRDVKGFQAIDVGGAATVSISQGKNFSCTVELDSNLQKDFITEIEKGVLKMYFRPGSGVMKIKKLEIALTMPALSGVKASGASRIDLEDAFSGDELLLELSGASSMQGDLDYTIAGIKVSGASKLDVDGSFGDIAMELSGASKAYFKGQALGLSGDVSGASHIDADALGVQDIDLKVSGASNVTLGEVAKTIKADLSGASHMTYSGTPDILKDDTSGSSSLKCR